MCSSSPYYIVISDRPVLWHTQLKATSKELANFTAVFSKILTNEQIR